MKELLILNLQVSDRSFEAELQDGILLNGIFYATIMEMESPSYEDGRMITPGYDVTNVELDELVYSNEEGECDAPSNESDVLEELKSLLSGYA